MDNYPKIDLCKIISGGVYVGFHKVVQSRPEVLEILSSYDFNESQIKQIIEAFADELTLEQIKSCAMPNFNSEQMQVIFQAYKAGLTIEQMTIAMDSHFPAYQMQRIVDGIKNGLDEKQLKLYAQKGFKLEQIEQIYGAIKDGLGIGKTKVFAKPEFSAEQMKVIRSAFDLFGKKSSYKQVRLIANPKLNVEQMSTLMWAYEVGLTIKEVRNIARHCYNEKQMLQIIYAYLDGFSDEQMAFFLNPKLNESQMSRIRYAIVSELSNEEISTVATGEYDDELMKIIISAYKYGVKSYVGLLLNPEFDVRQVEVISNCCDEGLLSLEQIAFLAKPKYNCYKMEELARWFMDGFSIVQVQVYADKFNDEQLTKIRYGLKHKLGFWCLWVKPEFSAPQMQEIIYGIKKGYTKEQLLLYANPDVPNYQMAEICADIDVGVPTEKVALYAKCIDRESFEKERTKVLAEEIQKLIN